MKRDEIRELIPDITEEQLGAIMKANGADVNREKARITDIQRQLDEANERIAALTEESEQKSKASMTLEERLKAIEESYAAKERDLAMEKSTLAAEKVFAGAGLAAEDYAPLMAALVSTDAEATVANANAIAALVASQRQASEAATRQALLKETPSPDGSTVKNQGTTKEQFDAMTYAERLSLLENSPDTYNELSNS